LPLTGTRNKVADLIDEGNKIKILDVCTGTGTQAFAFAKRGYEVIGLNLSIEMLKIAEKKTEKIQAKAPEGLFVLEVAEKDFRRMKNPIMISIHDVDKRLCLLNDMNKEQKALFDVLDVMRYKKLVSSKLH